MTYQKALRQTIWLSSAMVCLCVLALFMQMDRLLMKILVYAIIGLPLIYVVYRMFKHQYGMAELFLEAGIVRQPVDKGVSGWFGKILRSENYKVLKKNHVVVETAKLYRLATITSYLYFFVLLVNVIGVIS